MSISVRIEAQLGGGPAWTDLDTDAYPGIRGERGIQGDRIDDLVEDIPVMTFWVDNSEGNTGGLNGYYTLEHPNTRAGWEIGIGIRFVVNVVPTVGEPEDVPYWTGELVNVSPEPGLALTRRAQVEARGYTDQLARQQIKGVEVIQGPSEDDLVSALYAAMPFQPPGLTIDEGPDTFDFGFDLSRDGRFQPYQELQRIAQSSLRLMYSLGDGTQVNEARTTSRAVVGNPLTPEITLLEEELDGDNPPVVEEDRADKPNIVRARMQPRRSEVEAENPPIDVVFEHPSEFTIAPGETVTILGHYRDPDELGVGAGGADPIATVPFDDASPSTPYDFRANDEPNTPDEETSGDLTDDIAFVTTFSGTAVEFALTNNTSPGQTAYIPELRARAIGVYSQEQLTLEARLAQAVIDVEGERILELNMPYQDSPDVAQSTAQWILDTRSTSAKRLRRVTMPVTDCDPDRALELLRVTPSTLTAVDEKMTGLDVSDVWWVQGNNFVYGEDRVLRLTWPMVPAYDGFEVAFGAGHLTTGGLTSAAEDISEAETGFVSPTDGPLVYLIEIAAKTSFSNQPGAPTVTGLGLTWELVEENQHDTTGADRRTMWVFGAVGTPTAGRITMSDFDGTGQLLGRLSWSVCELPTTGTTVQAVGTGAVVQAVSGAKDIAPTDQTLTLTLAAFDDAANRTFGCYALSRNDTMTTEGSPWEILGLRKKRTCVMTTFNPDVADLTCEATAPGGGGRMGGIALEIKQD